MVGHNEVFAVLKLSAVLEAPALLVIALTLAAHSRYLDYLSGRSIENGRLFALSEYLSVDLD